jgi:hypothetical protein
MSPGIIGTYLALAGYAARRLTRRRRPRTTRTSGPAQGEGRRGRRAVPLGHHRPHPGPGITLLQLMTQSFYRAKPVRGAAGGGVRGGRAAAGGRGRSRRLPPSADSRNDRDRAAQDLQRIFATGGVSALIGHTYAADKDGGVFATGEAIRGLVQLEAQERDRAAGMAAKAVAAGLATRQVELAERQGQLVAEVIRCERLAEEYRRNADRIDAAALTDGTQR